MLSTPEDILAAYQERKNRYEPMHAAMRHIHAIYEGRVTIPLPDKNKNDPASVPNLLAQGIDQTAGRIASTTPMVTFAPDKPGVRKSEREATTKTRVLHGWWQTDRLTMKMKRRARHLIAYGMSPSVITFNEKTGFPSWNVRSPLETYPSPETRNGYEQPADVIFAYQRSVKWLRNNGYGPHATYVTSNPQCSPDTLMTLIEYICPQGMFLVLAGYQSENNSDGFWLPNTYDPTVDPERAVYLTASPIPVMTASVPTRISLERPGGQFDSMVGMYYQQAKLMALEVAAVEKGVFPDTYLESRPGEVARFVDGPYDGRTGKVNIVSGGAVRELANVPGYMTPQTIDRLERSQRLTAGIPSEFGGESGTNIRTGRRGDAVLSAVIDFPIAEAQEVFGYALRDENEAAIELAKFYAGEQTKTVYVGTGNAARATKYVANDVFTETDHTVAYPAAGSDLNSLMIGLGQRVGMGTMSKETAATLDPFIESPELEHDRIIAEGLEQSLVAGIQQQAASGAIPPLVLGKIMTLVQSDKMELAEALTKVTEDAAREAEAAAAEQQQGAPTAEQMMAPAAAGSMAGPEAMGAMPGPSADQDEFANLLGRLRLPVMGVQPTVGTNGRV